MMIKTAMACCGSLSWMRVWCIVRNRLYNAGTDIDSQCRAVQLRCDSDKAQHHWTFLWVLTLIPVLVPVPSNKDDNKHLDPAVFRALRHVSGPTEGFKPAFQLFSAPGSASSNTVECVTHG